MTQEQNTPGGEGPQTLGDVQRWLAKTCVEIRKGIIEPNVGGVLVAALGCLAKVMADRRDSKWTARTRQMWEEFERVRNANVKPETSDAQH